MSNFTFVYYRVTTSKNNHFSLMCNLSDHQVTISQNNHPSMKLPIAVAYVPADSAVKSQLVSIICTEHLSSFLKIQLDSGMQLDLAPL